MSYPSFQTLKICRSYSEIQNLSMFDKQFTNSKLQIHLYRFFCTTFVNCNVTNKAVCIPLIENDTFYPEAEHRWMDHKQYFLVKDSKVGSRKMFPRVQIQQLKLFQEKIVINVVMFNVVSKIILIHIFNINLQHNLNFNQISYSSPFFSPTYFN